MQLRFTSLLLICSYFLGAQEMLDTAIVSASRFEQSLINSNRNVQVISGAEIAEAPVNTVAELLDFMTGIDARQRGSYGTQTDLSIRGGNFEQVLVLVNGVRLADPQTGHHLMNLPVPKEEIERIELLLGGGSYIFGANAFSGALNIITKKTQGTQTNTKFSYGSFNTLQSQIGQSFSNNTHQTRVSLSHNRSDGFKRNTDFVHSNASLQSEWKVKEDQFSFQAGYTDQAFGAQNFYSTNFPEQFERTQTLFGSLNWQSEGKLRLNRQIYWRRNWDEFQLYRESEDFYRFVDGRFESDYNTAPEWYTNHNHHRSDVAGAKVDAQWDNLWGKTAFGIDYRYEQILSNNLGDSLEMAVDIPNERESYFLGAARHNLSGAIQHLVNLRKLQLSGAVQINYNSDFDLGLYPALNAGYRLTEKQKIYASFNRSFRLPSYTDLYYRLGGALGSIDLKEEESLNYEIGYRFFLENWYFNLSLFRRQGKNIIDWTQACDTCDLIAGNTSKANFFGGELSLRKQFEERSLGFVFAELGYAYLQTEQEQAADTYRSLYVFDYLRHKISLRIKQEVLIENLSLNYYFSYQARAGEFQNAETGQLQSYPEVFLINLSLNYQWENWNFFANAQNLLDQPYFDRANVELPGLWVTTGLSYRFDY